ncbi:MAG TPA: META domain-containing protein [Vicinamibacterales bacterium]
MSRRPWIVLLIFLVFPSPSLGARLLICFGNEPSWSVDLTTPGRGTFKAIGEAPVTYHGNAVTLEPLGETAWRGSAAGKELVLFMREAACSDGMSDVTHPVIARVSLADGRFLAGCCRVPDGSRSSAEDGTVEGVTWRLTALTGHSSDVLASAPRPVTVRFEKGRITGFSGCNRFTGSYTAEGDRITIGQLGGTMMACGPEAMALEQAVKEGLKGILRHGSSGDRLTLTSEAGTVLTFTKEDGRLDGATWLVTGYNNGRSALVSPLGSSRITLTFTDGFVSGSAGCNSFRAAYTLDGQRITMEPAVTTRKACGDDLMEQEREFLAALQSAVTFSVEGDGLDMHRQDGERAIHATAAR